MRSATVSLLFGLVLCATTTTATASDVPNVVLHNAGSSILMPAVGLGCGAYGMENEKYGTYPECIDEVHPPDAPSGPKAPGCGSSATIMVETWLQLGGRRLDHANSYYNTKSVGEGIKRSGVPRKEVFLLTKVGPTFPLGYNDSITQFEELRDGLGVEYVDLLLIHWPSVHPGGFQSGVSSDQQCITTSATFSEKGCRLSTWRGVLEIQRRQGARGVGVANYNTTHLQEIIDANLPLPSVNQIHFFPYNAKSQMDLVLFCQRHNITVLAYSPLGTPDFQQYPTTNGMSPTVLVDPVVMNLATKYGVSPAQIVLNFEYKGMGVPPNPRSMNPKHMLENMNFFNFTMTTAENAALLELPQDYCSVDPDWYECIPDPAAPARS